MKIKSVFVVTLLAAAMCACGGKPAASNVSNAKPSPAASVTPEPTASTPKNGDYPGKGVVTKIKLEGDGSIEVDHEEIKDLMPPMLMEFFVSDKKMLDGLKVGDKIDFVIRYKDRTETIVSIKKAQ